MIVTIDDYRGAADSVATPSSNDPTEDDDLKFTVASAGRLKLRLRALNDALTRTPPDQHLQLPFDEIVRGTSSRTYVNGSEEVYFMLKGLSWPNNISRVFIKAYCEVLRLRPFTNAYSLKPVEEPHLYKSIAGRFAPTFSDVRPMLLSLDTICDTTLDRFFRGAEDKVKSFSFLKLPAELRLQIYDFLIPHHSAYIPMVSQILPLHDDLLPQRLDILRVCKTVHDEVIRQCFNQRVILLRACQISQNGISEKTAYFSTQTTADFARRITSINSKLRRKLTQLEIRILPTGDKEVPASAGSFSEADKTSFRQIYDSLPNLESILFSYEKADPKYVAQMHSLGGRPDASEFLKRRYYNSMAVTLDWVWEMLPVEGPRILWDLTYYRESGEDMKYLKSHDVLEGVVYERAMMELLKKNGSLELAQSVIATREDLQRWLEVKDRVLRVINDETLVLFSRRTGHLRS